MRAAVENGKVDAVVVAMSGVKFLLTCTGRQEYPPLRSTAGQVERLERVVQGDRVVPQRIELGEGDGRAIAEALRVNSTLSSLPLGDWHGKGRRTGNRRGIARE